MREASASIVTYTPPLTLYCGKRAVATTDESTWEKQVLPVYGKINFVMD